MVDMATPSPLSSDPEVKKAMAWRTSLEARIKREGAGKQDKSQTAINACLNPHRHYDKVLRLGN